ncbi:universal stress protein [Williamsia sp.]|uniref:universal stress protein n=1 Tax=Williamsia sp. TaxID=1872085 RepID=UPI001A1D035F|nr:universal stress protein [Williamsia sp.]MBJ7288969.1 universal stress protein [Williamsia sp.]MBJ7291047.1 universal stress protein [Williamsia sp.]
MSTDARSRITVGYLATQSGDDGVALAVALAEATGAAVDLVCVVRSEEPDGTPGRAAYQDMLVARAQEWLAQGAKLVPEALGVELHAPVAESFTEGLIDFAAATGAEMIVVGGTRDGLFGRHTLGSISSELVHCSPLPVALAPRGYSDRADVPLTSVTVAVPTTTRGDNPLPFALSLAEEAGMSIRLVSLVSLDDGPLADSETSAQTRARHVAAATAILDEARDGAETTQKIESVVAEGDTLDEAMEMLRWTEGDIVAVGSARLGPPSRAFLGSTAARILRGTTAPIIVVPKSGV